jgi:hypothetical protein
MSKQTREEYLAESLSKLQPWVTEAAPSRKRGDRDAGTC